jgi:hypothetical protein
MYHLSRWKDTGYLDWLAKQEHEHQLELKLNWIDRLAGQGPAAVQRASMTLLAHKLFETIARTDSSDLSQLLENRPEKITALINCFARFCHESLELTKFHEEVRDKQQALVDAQLVDKGAPSAETIKRMKQELRIFFRKLLTQESATQPGSDPQTASNSA